MVLFPVFTVFTVFSMDFILVSMDFILVCASACWVFTRDSNLVAQAGAPSIFEANFWASKDTSSAWSFDVEKSCVPPGAKYCLPPRRGCARRGCTKSRYPLRGHLLQSAHVRPRTRRHHRLSLLHVMVKLWFEQCEGIRYTCFFEQVYTKVDRS
jgi:hypothetical protein